MANKPNRDASPRTVIGQALKIDTNNAIISDERISPADEENQDVSAEAAWSSSVGVSISRTQTWLSSPQTPATVKASAIENAGGFFDGLENEDISEEDEGDDDDIDEHDDTKSHLLSHPFVPTVDPVASRHDATPSDHTFPSGSQHEISEAKLPSPWRAEPHAQWQTGNRHRSGMFDGFFPRRRANSGAESSAEVKQRSLLSNFTSLSAFVSSWSSGTQSPPLSRNDRSKADQVTGINGRATVRRRDSDGPFASSEQIDPADALSPLSNAHMIRRSSSMLRRSVSDHSLATTRTLTRMASLGDDSRFENVNAQFNNRLQAIRDSWQDSSIRLSSLSNIKVPSLNTEFLKERAAPRNKRHSHQPDLGRTGFRAQSNPHQSIYRAKEALPTSVAEDSAKKPAAHPHFRHALQRLEGDVVVLGGYRGSVLRSAESPHQRLWPPPLKIGMNLGKADLEVGWKSGDDVRATETIIPDGMLTHIGPVDISRRLLKRLRECEKAQIYDYGYDWRLSPHHLSNELLRYLEGLPCNQDRVPKSHRGATVIAHSLGGLITRHAVNQKPTLFRHVIYAGVPQTCVNILGPMRNGDDVFLNSNILSAQVNFSVRTSFALLPLDGRCFLDMNNGEKYDVDFFDVNTWNDYRLSPCVSRPLPPLASSPAPPRSSGITGYLTSVANALPSLPLRGRKDSIKASDPAKVASAGGAAAPTMGSSEQKVTETPNDGSENDSSSASTVVTISKAEAMEYLARTLKEVKRFKEELAFDPKIAEANAYPPIAVIYGKSTPTVYGAKVDGRDGIKRSNAFDSLAFGSGDGVCLSRAAMAPEGYTTARGGVVASTRGHIGLLGDLEAVGRCLNATMRARRQGVGDGQVASDQPSAS